MSAGASGDAVRARTENVEVAIIDTGSVGVGVHLRPPAEAGLGIVRHRPG